MTDAARDVIRRRILPAAPRSRARPIPKPFTGPRQLTKQAMALGDDRYPFSWLPPDAAEAAREASELAERGPEAFPD